jgi:hypothetical protein
MRFERLRSHRSKQDRVQIESRLRSPGHCQMAEMRRVKTASKKSHTLAHGRVLIHLLIVSRLTCRITFPPF